MFLWRKEKRPVHKRLLVSVCKKNLVLQIERAKPVKCEDNRVMQVHDRTGKPVESSAHTHCNNLVLPNIVILHHQRLTSSTLQSMGRTST